MVGIYRPTAFCMIEREKVAFQSPRPPRKAAGFLPGLKPNLTSRRYVGAISPQLLKKRGRLKPQAEKERKRRPRGTRRSRCIGRKAGWPFAALGKRDEPAQRAGSPLQKKVAVVLGSVLRAGLADSAGIELQLQACA